MLLMFVEWRGMVGCCYIMLLVSLLILREMSRVSVFLMNTRAVVRCCGVLFSWVSIELRVMRLISETNMVRMIWMLVGVVVMMMIGIMVLVTKFIAEMMEVWMGFVSVLGSMLSFLCVWMVSGLIALSLVATRWVRFVLMLWFSKMWLSLVSLVLGDVVSLDCFWLRLVCSVSRWELIEMYLLVVIDNVFVVRLVMLVMRIVDRVLVVVVMLIMRLAVEMSLLLVFSMVACN